MWTTWGLIAAGAPPLPNAWVYRIVERPASTSAVIKDRHHEAGSSLTTERPPDGLTDEAIVGLGLSM